jgi:hypothetical protein
MPPQSSPLTAPSRLEASVSERLDWKYALLGVPIAFMFVGISAFFRFLPIRTPYADFLAMAVVLVWQYGIHRKIFSSDSDGSTAAFSSLSQGVLNLVATFVILMTVFSWIQGGPTSYTATLALIVSLAIVLTKYRSKASRSRSANA